MLTKRQNQVLDYIKEYLAKHDYAPSLEEIKRYLRISSVSTAHYHVQALQNMGYLRKEDNQPRALDVFSEQNLIQIPILGTIAAGQPIEAIEHKENIAIPQTRLHGTQYHFALRVNGESMTGENINDGDIIIVRRQPTVENGQKVVALINGNEVTLKKLYRDKDGIRLVPANSKHKPICVSPENIRVQGVVVDIIKNASNETSIPRSQNTVNQKRTRTLEPKDKELFANRTQATQTATKNTNQNSSLMVLQDKLKELRVNRRSRTIHFYWSQKSIRIAEEIYRIFCKPNQIVFDPFMGAGSSVYALRNLPFSVRFIGCDINQLPIEITRFNIKNKRLVMASAEKLFTLFRNRYEHYYVYTCPKCSREAFFVKAILNLKSNMHVKEVTISCNNCGRLQFQHENSITNEYLKRQRHSRNIARDLGNMMLIKNSRIAAKEGMKISDLFSPLNFHLLSYLRDLITESIEARIVLASILHLCRFTDKKSQSQFPYWYPRNNAVDRNVFNIIDAKLSQIRNNDHPPFQIQEVRDYEELKKSKNKSLLLLNKPIQNVNEIPAKSVDFVLTDPPYFDQVAYSEYLKMWEFFTGFRANLEDEIIESQRDINPSNEETYIQNIEKSFRKVAGILKNNGLALVYFKDTKLEKWSKFIGALQKAGLSFQEQIHLPKSKFTYKQNMSPKSTVGGDCLLMFRKRKLPTASVKKYGKRNLNDADKIIVGFTKGYLFAKKNASLGEIYDNGLIKSLLDSGQLDLVKDVSHMKNQLDKNFTWNKTQRKWSLNSRSLKNELLLADSLEVMKSIPPNSFDACITDPPYNISGYDHKKEIGWYKSSPYWREYKKFNKIDEAWDRFSDKDYLQFTKDWLTEISRVVKPNGNLAIFGSLHNIYKIGFILEEMGLRIINSIVWYKRNAFPNITNRMLCESTEHIIWATNNSKKHAKGWTFNYKTLKNLNNGKQMRNMWDIPSTPVSEKKLGSHPAQKSKEVVTRLILGCTNENDVVIDPFMGAGTIPLACKENGRYFLGIEKNPEYFLTSHRRLKHSNIQLELLTESD